MTALGQARILAIEDDEEARTRILAELARHGLQAEGVADGYEGLRRALSRSYDAITLDRMLPGMDGLAVVTELRRAGVATPVLMISALGDVDERVGGLRAGGDDYLVKPYAPQEMIARIEVLLRRGAREAAGAAALAITTLKVGDLELDLLARTASRGGERIELLPTEFRLLEFLVRNAGQVLSRQIIFERVWQYYFDPGANLINVHVARLRRKLETPGSPPLIATVRGSGYRFDAGP